MHTPCSFVIFGATGDLSRRYLYPALFDLERNGRLDADLRFVAVGRREHDNEGWREDIAAGLAEERPTAGIAALERFAGRFDYVRGEHAEADLYRRLADSLARGREPCANVIFYLAIPPGQFGTVVEGLGNAGLNDPERGHRLVVEKPFGRDHESAQQLNALIGRYFAEEQIYRIDHFLGKTAVQNLLVLRFANAVIEPLWNARYIDHVEITVAEAGGIGSRAGYFDRAGTLRDMMQNHLLQVLALVAMEPPATLGADDLRSEKEKVLRSIRRLRADEVDAHAVRARYTAGTVGGEPVPGYQDEPGVPGDSRTETYVALRVMIDNWRWGGVPFYLRSGKRLATSDSFVAIRFREPPHHLFGAGHTSTPNWLLLSIRSDGTIRFELQTRAPGLDLSPATLSIDATAPDVGGLGAYATLLLDVIENDRTLFLRFDEVETAWSVVAPIQARWQDPAAPLHAYAAGTFGPAAADELLQRDGRQWRNRP